MNRRALLGGLAAAGVGAAAAGAWWGRRPPARTRTGPNVVVVLTDDQGYNDLGCYYTPPPDERAYAAIDTPNLDRLAAEGLRHTRFYVGAAVCTPSRAALLTGCYPPRVGFGAMRSAGAGPGVLTPTSKEGLNPAETTLADLFRAAGYHTACIGKWHLGHHPPFRPTRHGFDEFFGIPWSNNQVPLALYRGDERLRPLRADEPLVDLLTREALEFVARCGDDPFFLYLAHSAPHEPWAVEPGFAGTSARGAYGDAVRAVDASVGTLVAALRSLPNDTIVVFLSDNGPWLEPPVPGGSAWPYRGGKADSWEGGFRSPCVVWWPGTIAAGRTTDTLCAAMDLLPTLVARCGLAPPPLAIDGVDVGAVWAGTGPSPRSHFGYWARGRLEAITDGRWKRMYPVPERTPPVPAGLYDLAADPGESNNLLGAAPEVAARLDVEAAALRVVLGDALSGRRGTENRPVGRI